MNKQLLCYLLIAGAIVSCKPKEQNNSYEAVVTIVDEAESIVDKYDSAVYLALENKKTDYIKILSKGAVDSTNLKLNDLKNLEIDPPNEDLRTSSINYIQALQKIVIAENTYASINDTTSIETAKKMDENVSKEINQAEQLRYKYRLELKKSMNQ
ncbi:hypothetical protein [Dysgonomonas macrotermitis]|uniref:Uncharacterized protein n=1 Tax=Dysgonomonas macrotermitis TaxID=1346286 RepID=A0A1M5BAX2_9BACT|nr:hypothetical protein [Dysgonomonas macrotermitis]SHF39565.1 hypothetical protein SAMN05444362_1065 [Dysgonomonas macrotermitis]